MERKLTTGEWRLFLLSDCIKYFPDVRDFTEDLRKSGKAHVLDIDGDDSKELDNFISTEDATKIRVLLRKEWRFTGKVVDNGRGIKSTCEYCQKQQIRYRYLCRNDKTNQWLSLGSVCVGYVIHGEAKMKDKDFADKFVSDLDKLRGSATTQDEPEIDLQVVKAEQAKKIKLYVGYLRGKGVHMGNSEFLTSLHQRWMNGKLLTDNQMTALENMCKKIKYQEPVQFKNLDAEVQYQKVCRVLENKPDNQFYQNCKLYLERNGELTPNMARALMGGA